MPNWNHLTENQKEILHRLQDEEILVPDDGAFKGVPDSVWKFLVNEGWIEITIRPLLDINTLEVVPNWRETGQYNHVIRRILPVGEPDISTDDIAKLKNLCEKYGNKRIARLAECKAWINREKDNQRRAERAKKSAYLAELKKKLETEKTPKKATEALKVLKELKALKAEILQLLQK